jgi:hypothetical protein
LAEIPKYVVERLRAAEINAKEHPSADLLAAFAERTLTVDEREHVLRHLSTCAVCREVVSLTQPETETQQTVHMQRARQHWFWTPALRFAAVAAVLVLAATGLLMYRSRRPASPAEPTTAEIKPPAAPQAKQEEEITNARRMSETVDSAAKAPAPAENKVQYRGRRYSARQQAEQKERSEPMLADKVEPKAKFDLDVRSRERVRKSEQGFARKSKVALNAPYPLPAQTGSVGQAGVVGGVVRNSAPAIAAAAPSSDLKTQVAQAQGAPERISRDDETAAATNEVHTQTAAEKDLLKPALAKKSPSIRWTISSSGGLLRSNDNGRTWQAVWVADKTVFRTVASIPPEVWAGGSNGALYYSENAGTSWQRLTVAANGTELKDEIASLNFSDSQHAKLITTSGEVWTTTDGCRTWQRER